MVAEGRGGGWERQFIHYWATSDVTNVQDSLAASALEERAAPNLETDKCTALLRPLKLAQLKLGTVQIPLP
jgi:hypothetical protein